MTNRTLQIWFKLRIWDGGSDLGYLDWPNWSHKYLKANNFSLLLWMRKSEIEEENQRHREKDTKIETEIQAERETERWQKDKERDSMRGEGWGTFLALIIQVFTMTWGMQGTFRSWELFQKEVSPGVCRKEHNCFSLAQWELMKFWFKKL